jgi:amidohydrolase
MDVFENLKAQAAALQPQLIDWRRDFHQHPELGFQETRTAGIVADYLQGLGLEVATGIGGTGVVAVLEGAETDASGSTVLLRFDMDALPISEENDLPFRSQTPGVMHACGHDGHTAIGMGTARLLTEHRGSLKGRVKLVFQPAEEGLGGARAMIHDGVLDDPVPDASFAMHLWTQLPLNQVVAQAGPLWASADMFRLEVTGRGGHGAAPHETIDATVVACEIVMAWQTIISRTVDPMHTAVVTVGEFASGSAVNAVSGHASLGGTIRTFDPEVEQLVKKRMVEIADGICQAHGAKSVLSFPANAPTTINSEEGAALMRDVASHIVGDERVTTITPMMVSEDMSEFLNRVPGCYILVGASDSDFGWHSPHHNATFDFDERVLPTGVALMTAAALQYLEKNS